MKKKKKMQVAHITENISDKERSEVVSKKNADEEKNEPAGYPLYPEKEDVYKQWKEEKDLNPEETDKIKTRNGRLKHKNEKDFEDDVSGDDLDTPGSEFDDDLEIVGSEDEENNYYSLGSDNYFN